MPRMTPAHRQARREQIARAAISEFSKHGIHSTTMANIIRASGLSSGAIYTHFAGKGDIIAFVAHGTFEALFSGVETVAQVHPSPEPEEMVGLIVARIQGAAVPAGLLVQVWSEAVTNPVVREAVNAVYHRAFAVLAGYAELWLGSSPEASEPPKHEAAAVLAGHMISLIYAQVLQASVIDNYEPGTPGAWPKVI